MKDIVVAVIRMYGVLLDHVVTSKLLLICGRW